MKQLGSCGALLWLGLFHCLSLAAEDLRLLVPGLEPGALPGRAEAMLARHEGKTAAGPHEIDEASLAGVDAVLLDHRAMKMLERRGEPAVLLLESVVERGVGLVVVGAAAGGLPASEKLTRLLGRKPIARVNESRRDSGVTLDIPDQSHPATQCVTSLFLSATVLQEGNETTTVLGRTITGAPETPDRKHGGLSAFWTRTAGKGRIVVIALQVPLSSDAGMHQPTKTALAFLAARSLQWAAGRTVTVGIPEAMPLAAERLGPEDAGCLPGLPAVDGFYRGRQIAPVMGFQGADWLVRKDREETEQPEKVLDALAVAEGSTVADVGAGNGYFTFRLARRVGPSGRVLATDLQEEMLRLLRERIEKEGARNIEPILATETDPHLPADAVDLALMVDVYHELSKPAEVLRALRRTLKAGGERKRPGRLVLIEYRGEDPLVAIKPLHRTTVQQIRAEIEPRGFKLLDVKGFLPYQHVLVFEKR